MKLPLLLDGATGTNLMEAGMERGACPEQWILEHPVAIQSLQSAYAQSGCDAVYAPTFGANRVSLSHYGLGEKVADFNRQLVALTREAVGADVLVGGDMSSTALQIEPFGDTSFEELVEVYAEQAAALQAAGVDFIAAETLMSLYDARAAVLGAKSTGLPILTSITLQPNGRTLSGASPLSCLVTLQEMGIAAFGINCSSGPDGMEGIVASLMHYAKVPIAIKPNAGRLVDGKLQNILQPEEFAAQMMAIMGQGARIVGGCCGTTPAHMQALRRAIDSSPLPDLPEVEDVAAAASEREVFFLAEEMLEPSPAIPCTSDLAEDLIDMEDEGYNLLTVEVQSREDALELAENAHMSRLPLAILSHSREGLETALRLYQGRALVVGKSELPEETLRELAGRYGAMLI